VEAAPSDNISVDADRGRKSPGNAVIVRTASCRFIGGFSVSSVMRAWPKI
jgi:hypothetical protein